MKDNVYRSRIRAVVFAAVPLLAVTVAAQTPKVADTKPACVGCAVGGKIPRFPDEHPNLSGFWNTPPKGDPNRQLDKGDDGSILLEFSINFDETIPGNLCLDDSCQQKNQPPYNEKYMAKAKAVAETMYLGTSSLDPEMACKPYGLPRTGVGSMQLVQTPQVLAILYESAPNSIYRLVYLDGRSVPEDLDYSYMGYSTGRWEGDTLVIDTVKLNDDTWLGGQGHGRSKYTSIHSDQLHVIERWTRVANTLTVETTVEDPAAFTRPWVLAPRKVEMASSGDYLHEAICSQVNMSGSHMILPTEKDKGQLYNGSKNNAIK